MFAPDLINTNGLLVAVGRQRAEQFAACFETPRAHGSYQALAEDPVMEAIYIASPHSEHAAHAELALSHGKHVLVEKPLALTVTQARRIREAAHRAGLFAMEAMRTRFLPHTLRIHELIAEGALGDIRMLIADHHQKLDLSKLDRVATSPAS